MCSAVLPTFSVARLFHHDMSNSILSMLAKPSPCLSSVFLGITLLTTGIVASFFIIFSVLCSLHLITYLLYSVFCLKDNVYCGVLQCFTLVCHL